MPRLRRHDRLRTTVDAALTRWFSTAQLDYRAVASLLVPVIVSQAFVIGFSALSPLLVASTGIEAISAVSTVEYLNVFVLSVFIALATAGSVLVAQHVGRGDHEAVRRAAGGALWAAVIPAAVAGAVLLVLHRPVVEALLGGAGEQVVSYGKVYFAGSALSFPAYAIVEASSAVLRANARTAPALYLTVAMNGGYLLLAVGLVKGAGLGVAGLAIAMVTARFAAAGMALWLLRRDRVLGVGGRWPVDWSMVWRVTAIGLPFVAEQAFINGGKLLSQMFVVGMGTMEITANAVAQSLIGLSEIVPQAMCIALVPLVGQAIGAGRPSDARRVIRSFLWASTIVSVVTAAVMLTGFGWLLGLYQTPPEVASKVLTIFLMASIARLLGWWALSYLLPSGLRAAGDAVFATTVATVTMAARVAFIWLIGVHFGHGVVGIWAVMVAEWAVRSLVFGLRFRGSRWEQRSLVRAEQPALSAASGT